MGRSRDVVGVVLALLAGARDLRGQVALADAAAVVERKLREIEGLTCAAAPDAVLDAIASGVPDLLWLTGLTHKGLNVEIRGEAMNAAAIATFVANLERMPRVREVELQRTDQRTDGVFRFMLRTRLSRARASGAAAAAPLAPAAPAGAPRDPGRERARLEAKLASLERVLVKEQEVPEVLQRVEDLAGLLGLQVIGSRPAAAGEPGRFYEERRHSLVVRGSYHGLASFLDRLARQSRVVTASSIDVRRTREAGDGERIEATVTVCVIVSKGGSR